MAGGIRTMAAVAVVAAGLALAGCGDQPRADLAVGDPARGQEQFVAYNCGSCHRVDGTGQSDVGPALDDLADQRMIAGVLPMTPEFLAAWIVDPPAHDPETGMPDVGVSHEDARDIAAWLLDR